MLGTMEPPYTIKCVKGGTAPLTKNLKTINTLLKNNIYASYSKLSEELKCGTDIFVGQNVLKLWIKTVKMLFGSINQEQLCLYPNSDVIFEFLGQFTIRYIIIFKKGVDNFANFGAGGAVPP